MAFDPKKIDPEKILTALHMRPRQPTEEEKQYGSFNRRMIAAVLDTLIISITIAPVVDYFFMQSYGLPTTDVNSIIAQASQAPTPGEALRQLGQGLQESGLADRLATNFKWHFYVLAMYVTICWHFFAATPGKLLCRLKILDAKTGKPMGDWQSILRVAGYVLSAMPLGLGFFWIGMNRKRRGFHDYFAGTVVKIVPRQNKKMAATSAPESAPPSDSPAPSTGE